MAPKSRPPDLDLARIWLRNREDERKPAPHLQSMYRLPLPGFFAWTDPARFPIGHGKAPPHKRKELFDIKTV